jgi:hypothetical protein
MTTKIPEKRLKIVEEIDADGQANLTRLTVLKKWFERPERLTAFALWVAARAMSRKGKVGGGAAGLFKEARALLDGLNKSRPRLDRKAAENLHDRLREFQNEHQRQKWVSVRIVHNWNLLLVEEALAICIWYPNSPVHGYTLASDYFRNYDPQYGNSLNGSSRTKLLELVQFMFTLEALELEKSD